MNVFHLSKEDVEKERTPFELARFVRDVIESVNGDDELRKFALLKKGYYKEFLEEVVPLSIYCGWKFPSNDVKCKNILGNQPYDAVVLSAGSDILEYVEITVPIDGKKDRRESEQRIEKGRTDIECGDFIDKREDVIKRIIKVAKKKSLNDYSLKTSLIILMNTFPYFDIHKKDEFSMIQELINELREIDFNVGAVYLIVDRDIFPVNGEISLN